MGLLMENIHAPTVGSGRTSNGNSAGEIRDDISQLISKKDALESEMKALGSVLESHGVNMSTSLLTFDGFPRSDIDVAQIRTTRARIIHLQNDHKALLARIEPKLHEYFAANREASPDASKSEPSTASLSTSSPSRQVQPQPTSNTATRSIPGSASQPSPTRIPENAPSFIHTPAFAVINTVSPASPAESAGLQPGDSLHRFGDADATNHDRLRKLASIVNSFENREIRVVVQRNLDGHNGQFAMTLVPRSGWGGRGMLGCHILPLP